MIGNARAGLDGVVGWRQSRDMEKRLPFGVHRIVSGGAVQSGQQIGVTYQDVEGRIAILHYPYGLIPQLMDLLRTYAAMAIKARGAWGAPGVETIQPYVSRETPRLYPTREGPFLMRIITTEGIPVTVAFPEAQLTDLASGIDAAIAAGHQKTPEH